MVDYKTLGQRIRTARLDCRLTQEGLAERCGLSPDAISHIERSHTKVSLPSLVSIANSLNVSVDKLLSDSLYQSKEHFSDEVAKVFSDATSNEMYVMLQSAVSVKQAMRVRRLSQNEK